MSQSDKRKRTEIFLEFIYYIFDSLLIPLVRSNFHVTESNSQGYRLFFFRHDVWRKISGQSLGLLKLSMFEELKVEKARKVFNSRSLGFSQLRLMPKVIGARPIVNLKRRVMKKQNGRIVLGASINSKMRPVFSMLDFEKISQPESLGSSLFSVGDLYPKLKGFKASLLRNRRQGSPLYFVKVDVQSCFDTIPQQRLLQLVERLVSQQEYRVGKHVEIKPPEGHKEKRWFSGNANPIRKFIYKARAGAELAGFEDVVKRALASGKKDTIYVNTADQITHHTKKLLDLLQEHVQHNIVKIGKKYFRQKNGIPQGSVLSSLLCNFFYAKMEQEYLSFLGKGEAILLRLIDDFLLITTRKDHARRFVQAMINGNSAYGVSVNAAKSLANFEVMVNGTKIPRLHGTTEFPYCGDLINTRTLEISKDRVRKNPVIADSWTVEMNKTPGRSFHRKVLASFKIQTHGRFLDTSFNSVELVMSTIYQNFVESAIKLCAYVKSLPTPKVPNVSLIIGTIEDLMELANNLIQAKKRVSSLQDYDCAVTKRQIQWLGSTAFRQVLQRKQTKYSKVLRWLDGLVEVSKPRTVTESLTLKRIVKENEIVFRDYKF